MALVLVIGLLIAVVGGVGVVSPDVLQSISRYAVTPVGLYLAAAFRIAVGVVLVLVAAGSRAPRVLRVLGFIAIAAGLVTLFLGVDRARAIVDWWSGQGPVSMRLWPALALLFGVLIVVAALPRRRAA